MNSLLNLKGANVLNTSQQKSIKGGAISQHTCDYPDVVDYDNSTPCTTVCRTRECIGFGFGCDPDDPYNNMM